MLRLCYFRPQRIVMYTWVDGSSTQRLDVACSGAQKLCAAPDNTVYVVTSVDDRYHVLDFYLPALLRGAFDYSAGRYRIQSAITHIAASDEHVFVARKSLIACVRRTDGAVTHTIGDPRAADAYGTAMHVTAFCITRRGAAQCLAAAESWPRRLLRVYALDGSLLRSWDVDEVPRKCVYRAVSDELLLYVGAARESLYVFTGIMSGGDVHVRRVVRGSRCVLRRDDADRIPALNAT